MNTISDTSTSNPLCGDFERHTLENQLGFIWPANTVKQTVDLISMPVSSELTSLTNEYSKIFRQEVFYTLAEVSNASGHLDIQQWATLLSNLLLTLPDISLKNKPAKMPKYTINPATIEPENYDLFEQNSTKCHLSQESELPG